ncbi:hypothetical protein [Glacieibacterium sp.]|uniref:hypothetical protein n=1 Tax=Glacieibacterium sp. TaxID=2860237 RepID=UPI003B00711B
MAPIDQDYFVVRAKLHHDIASRATDAEVRRLNDEMAVRYRARAAACAIEANALAVANG